MHTPDTYHVRDLDRARRLILDQELRALRERRRDDAASLHAVAVMLRRILEAHHGPTDVAEVIG